MLQTLGVGLRSVHYNNWLAGQVDLPAAEALSENYTYTQGRPREILLEVAKKYSVYLHGVTLNIAGEDPLNRQLLRDLRDLSDQLKSPLISDHLCMTGMSKKSTFDLLPFPFTRAMILYLRDRILQTQDFLGQEIALENISTYFRYEMDEMTEVEFLNELVDCSGVKILLDVNNLFINSCNHGFDAREFLIQLNRQAVVAYHLGGHDELDTFRFDTHGRETCDEVKVLFKNAVEIFGPKPAFLERDDAVPEIDVLVNEIKSAAPWVSHGT